MLLYKNTHRYTKVPRYTQVHFKTYRCNIYMQSMPFSKVAKRFGILQFAGGANCRLPNGLLKCQTLSRHGFCNVCTVVVTHRYILGTSGYTKVHFGTFRWVHYQTRISRQALVHTGTYMYMHVTSGA